MELHANPASAELPTYQGIGAYEYPYPVVKPNGQICALSGNFVVCAPKYEPSVNYITAPGPIITWQETPIPFYDVWVWSPVSATVSCGTTNGYARFVTVDTTFDPTGTHTYLPLKSVTANTPANFALAAGFDYACAKAAGTTVPERVLP